MWQHMFCVLVMRAVWMRERHNFSMVRLPCISQVHNIQGIHKRMARFQKFTRNLFLTLHGHNVHRQQRQLSTFLVRYHQFAFRAYCGAAGSVSKMALQQEKAFCVLGFEVSRPVITVQREFRAQFIKDPPHRNNITRCYRQFVETGCLYNGKKLGRPRVSYDNNEFDYRVDVCRVT